VARMLSFRGLSVQVPVKSSLKLIDVHKRKTLELNKKTLDQRRLLSLKRSPVTNESDKLFCFS
jgi:hypothetical protein